MNKRELLDVGEGMRTTESTLSLVSSFESLFYQEYCHEDSEPLLQGVLAGTAAYKVSLKGTNFKQTT